MEKKLLIYLFIFITFYTYSQNVGIGNNNPQSKLHVTGAIRSDTLIYTSTGTVRNVFATPNGRIYDSLVALSPAWLINGNSNIGTTNFLGTLNANDLIFRTNNTEKARITSLGNLGIGTNAPSRLLHVFGTGVNNVAQLESNTPFTFLTLKALGDLSLNGIASAGNDNISIVTNAMERVRVNLNGNVGIGTLAPNNRLEITSVSANTSGLRFTNLTSASPTIIANGKALTVDVNGDVILVPAAAASNDWALLGNAGTTPATNFLGTTDNVDLVFRTNNTEKARILANGNMGVGTATPIYKLNVQQNFGVTDTNPFMYLNGTFGPIPNLASMGIRSAGEVVLRSNTNNNTIPDWEVKYGTGTNAFPNDFFYISRRVNPTAVSTNFFAITSLGDVGVNTITPRGKFDVLNGDTYVADNIFPQFSFNVGRSATSIYCDNIRPYTDNGFRIYDGNSLSHLRLEAVGQCQIQAYTTTGAATNLMETPGTEGVLSLNPTGGGVRVGIPNGLSTCINPALADNPIHKLTVGYGYFLAGNYNADPLGGQAPGTTWIGGVGALAVAMNRNSGKSHVDFWNTSDVTQAAANTNIDRGFEFRGYDNTYAERTMARIDGLGQFFSNGTFAISDKRFKTDIVLFNESVLEKLMQVKTYTYNMHQPVSKNGGALQKGAIVKVKDFGVLVQELYELFPGVVYKPKDESKEAWSVDYSRFSLYLLEGMKEQQQQINELKKQNEEILKLLKK